MSFSSEEEVDCPCGETFPAQLWNSVNFKEDPALRSILMGGELNVVTCSMCKGIVFTDRFVLVHDPDNEVLAFIHPKAREGEREFLAAAMRKDVLEAQDKGKGMKISYPPVLLFGLESFVELINGEQEATDQSEVLAAMGPSLSVKIAKLSPSAARAVGLPRRVPLGEGASAVDRLTSGLRAVLAANDRLTVYSDLLKKAEAGLVPAPALASLPNG